MIICCKGTYYNNEYNLFSYQKNTKSYQCAVPLLANSVEMSMYYYLLSIIAYRDCNYLCSQNGSYRHFYDITP